MVNEKRLIIFVFTFLISFIFPPCPPALAAEPTGMTPEQNLLFGQLMLDQEDFESAILHFKAAAELDTDNPVYLLHLGRTYEQLDEHENALDTYQQALKIHPNYIDALFAVGDLSRATHRWSEAISAYTRAAAVDPTSARTYFDMALSFEGWGRPEEALEAKRKAYEINPDFVIQASRLLGVEVTDTYLLAQPEPGKKSNVKLMANNNDSAISQEIRVQNAMSVKGAATSEGVETGTFHYSIVFFMLALLTAVVVLVKFKLRRNK